MASEDMARRSARRIKVVPLQLRGRVGILEQLFDPAYVVSGRCELAVRQRDPS